MAMAASSSSPATGNPCSPSPRLLLLRHTSPSSSLFVASPLLNGGARSSVPPPGLVAVSAQPSLRRPSTIRASSLSTAQVPSDTASADSPPKKATKYYFLVANAKFMLDEEEHFQELMRERLRLFGERKREQDFWLAIEPEFLEQFPDICKRLKRPAVALVSTDELWITFMKLRLDRVLKGEIESEKSLAEALKSSAPVDLTFDKPQTWTAPYPKYGEGWWTPFLPPQV